MYIFFFNISFSFTATFLLVLWMALLFFFFFSSRRRHTRLTCDWSSDVCSSDLGTLSAPPVARGAGNAAFAEADAFPDLIAVAVSSRPEQASAKIAAGAAAAARSEERRVGKEWRSRGSRDH